jgi:HD-GYP domain-containing protein (c-di-GMP phosphodiesterase class II)
MTVDQALDLTRLLELARWLDPQISADAEHSTRVSRIALTLADAAGLDGRDAALAALGGLLHDVGKIAVPMPILVKPGPLNDREFDQVMRHPAASGVLAMRAELNDLSVLLRHHHERWDGLGYPDRLAGRQIPLVARVLSIADAYDAMLADRPYRAALDAVEARRELELGAGTQFDPHLVDVFLRLRVSRLRRAA